MIPAPTARPARPDDLRVVIGWRWGLGPRLAEAWRRAGHKVILSLPRLPGPEHPLPPALRVVTGPRAELVARLADLPELIARAEPWRRQAGRNLNIPATTGVHLLDLAAEQTEDVLAPLGALGPRAGRLLFFSDPEVLGRAAGRPPLAEEAPTDPETPRAETLIAAETVARHSRSRGRVVVALRVCGWLYGDELLPETPLGPDERLADRLLRGDPVLWARGLTPTQPLHFDDLLAVLEALLLHPDPAPLYHVAGPEILTWDQLLLQLHRASGSREPPSVESLTAEQLSLHRPEAARRWAERAYLPLLATERLRREVYAPERRLAEEAPAWLRGWLVRLGVMAEVD